MTDHAISQQIEDALVARNLRGMAQVQPALVPGYCLRAARILQNVILEQPGSTVLIGTGFPVVDTFETDGPVGSIALYDCLESLGLKPVIVCGQPLVGALSAKYRTHEISVGANADIEQETRSALQQLNPQAIVSIERPGQAIDGGYYNMRGESISARTACFDRFMDISSCPTIAVGDGGNEIGMGKVTKALEKLDIVAAVTQADELIVADVSNWGAYGMIAFLGVWHEQDLLARIEPLSILQYLSKLGSVDGVTRINQLTEDGLPASEGQVLIQKLRNITSFCE